MNMNYIKFSFEVSPAQPGNEVLISYLAENGFESFIESESGFEAFIKEEEFVRENLPEEKDFVEIKFSYTEEIIPQKNWNEEWENSFDPVCVEDKICVRASFHPKNKNVKLDIVITPKMSFGTGHHDTTWLMLKNLYDLDLNNKSVLDMGCGTAVLAIAAKKLGAKNVVGIDIDEWSIENANENCEVNGVSAIKIFKGDASLLGNEKYDVILANINRNVLLADISKYTSVLNEGGSLLLSGFFESDFPSLTQECESNKLKKEKEEVRNGWGFLQFRK
jgi:ribosomal protein L11 methyltransferase